MLHNIVLGSSASSHEVCHSGRCIVLYSVARCRFDGVRLFHLSSQASTLQDCDHNAWWRLCRPDWRRGPSATGWRLSAGQLQSATGVSVCQLNTDAVCSRHREPRAAQGEYFPSWLALQPCVEGGLREGCAFLRVGIWSCDQGDQPHL